MNPKHVTFNYQAEAEQTNSPHYHATKVPQTYLMQIIRNCILETGRLDDIKKAVFYGRDLPQHTLDLFSVETKIDQMFEPESKAMTVPLVHAIIGIATEAGELLECFDKDVFDRVNFIEEVGDVLWYLAIGLNAVGSTFEEAQRTNIAKLRKRYPEKFTEYDANNRDLNAERDVLENPFREAYEMGQAAFHAMVLLEHNPYPPMLGVSSHSEWSAGWNDEYAKHNSPKVSDELQPPLSFGKSAAWEAGRFAHSVGRPRVHTGSFYSSEEEAAEWFAGWDHNERMTKEGQAIKRAFANSVKIGNDGIDIDMAEGYLRIGETEDGKKYVSGICPVEGAILRQDYYIDGHRLNFQQAQTYIALKQTGKLAELLDRYELPL